MRDRQRSWGGRTRLELHAALNGGGYKQEERVFWAVWRKKRKDILTAWETGRDWRGGRTRRIFIGRLSKSLKIALMICI